MPKRFLDTNFFKGPFMRSLPASSKLLYTFIICDCSSGGIWTIDLSVASIFCGVEITQKDLDLFTSTGKAVDLKNGRMFIPGFIKHQYPNGLSQKNPAHSKAITELKEYSIIKVSKGTIKVLRGPSEVPPRGTKVKEEVTVTVKEEEKVEVNTGPKKEKTKIEVVLPFDTDSFRTAWEGWKDYQRTQHRFSYKSPTTEQIALKHLSEMAGTEVEAIKIIQQSMANGWKGLFELKIVNGKSDGKNGYDSLKRKLAEEIITATGNSQ